MEHKKKVDLQNFKEQGNALTELNVDTAVFVSKKGH